MKVKVAYLYYDLMNLYGDSGNVKALKKVLKSQDIDVIVDKLSVDDKIDFDGYDFFIIGSGTEDNLIRVLTNFRLYKDEVKKAIEDNKIFLSTGNSIDLFGSRITDLDGNLYNGLGIFNYESTESIDRIVCESLVSTPLVGKNIIGFQNRGSKIDNFDFNLFEVIRGYGSTKDSKVEGIHYKNFFGTFLIGPILARNPELLKYFCKLLILSKDKDFVFKDFDLSLDEHAYNEFMNNHYPAYINK